MREIITVRATSAILGLLITTTAIGAEPSREMCVKWIQATQECLHNPACKLSEQMLYTETRCVKRFNLRSEWRAANDAAELKYDGKVH